MHDQRIKGVLYSNIVYTDKEYIVQRTNDTKKYNNRYRVVNTEGDRDNNHTHINGLGICKKLIELVKKNIIPHTDSKYLIVSCIRLTTDEEYKSELLDLYKKKKDKQQYYNKR